MTDWGRADLKEHATKQFCKLQPFVRKVLVMLWLMSCVLTYMPTFML